MLSDRADDVDLEGAEAVEPHPDMAGHAGYVVGRHVDGRLTDGRTDVRLHRDGRYTDYVPRCECGWTGPPFSATTSGFAACVRLWRTQHLELFLRARDPRSGRWQPTVIHGRILG